MDFTVYQLAWNKSGFFREPLKIPDIKKEIPSLVDDAIWEYTSKQG